jgi:zinc protease
MFRTAALALLTAAALFLTASAQAADDVYSFTLDNGMQGIVVTDNRAPVVTHMVWYRVGAADDPYGKSGIAHFLEHLMFKGTDDLAEGELSRTVAENGGTDNAFTTLDSTSYFQRVASDRLELMMEMEADRMRDLILTEEVVTPERGVVLEERGSRVDGDPGSLFNEQRQAAIYLNHPYGRPVIGWRHEIEGLTREDALDFYRTYYAPNNAILVVAGDVDPQEVEALARKYYGPLEPSDLPPRVRPQEPPQLAARRISFSDPRITQPYVIRSYLAPNRRPGDQNEAAALTVLADLLGGGITSYFSRRLELEEKVALSSGAYYSGLSLDPQTFTVYIVPAEGVSLEEAEDHLDATLAAFIEEGPDPDALARVITQIRASEIYALDNQSGRGRRYGAALAAGLSIEDVDAWTDLLASVTAEEVTAAARQVFDLRHSVTGTLTGEETE